MPRDGGGVYSKPAGTAAVASTTIESVKYNATIDDLVSDANAARPVSAGGTGAVNASDARTNLGVTPANIGAAVLAGSATQTFDVADATSNTHAVNRRTGDARYALSGALQSSRLLNGAMQVSQRRLAATVDVTTGTMFTVDNWFAFLSTTPGGTLRCQQIASTSPGGSPNRLRMTAQVSDGSIAVGDLYSIQQSIEGIRVADARFGAGGASQIILRLGVRSSLAGTFGVSIANSAGTRSWVGLIVVAGGEINTDLLRVLVIPGDTAGTWLTGAGVVGLRVRVCLAAGTDWHGAAGWQGSNEYTTSAQTNFMGTGGATFELFDAGLYIDPLAVGSPPAFEVPRFDEELTRCMRHYEKSYDYALAPGAVSSNGVVVGTSGTGALNNAIVPIPFKVRKLAVPVVTMFNPATGASGQIIDGAATLSAATVSLIGECAAYATNSGALLFANSTAYGHFTADASLA
jgi:hypothetical protein